MEGPIFEHEGALVQFHFGTPPSSAAPNSSSAASSKKRPREENASMVAAAPATSKASLRATVVRWRADSNSCTVQDVLVALPSSLTTSSFSSSTNESPSTGSSFILEPVASATVIDNSLGFASAFVLLRQVPSMQTSRSNTEKNTPSPSSRLVLCSASIRTVSVTQASTAKPGNALTGAPAAPHSRRVWRTEVALTTPRHLLESAAKRSVVSKSAAPTSLLSSFSSSESSPSASAASVDAARELDFEPLLSADEPAFCSRGSSGGAIRTKWQLVDGPMALGLASSAKPIATDQLNKPRISLLVYRRHGQESSSKWVLESIDLPSTLLSSNYVIDKMTDGLSQSGTPREDELDDEDTGDDGKEDSRNFSFEVVHSYPQHDEHELEVGNMSDGGDAGYVFWGSIISDGIILDQTTPAAPDVHSRRWRRQRLLALLRVGGHLFDLVVVSETEAPAASSSVDNVSRVLERTALVPSGHLPFNPSLGALPESSSNSINNGSKSETARSINLPRRSGGDMSTAFVLDGDPRAVHVTSTGPSTSAVSNGSIPGARLRSWCRVPGHPRSHEPISTYHRCSGGVVLGSWPLLMYGNSNRSHCIEALSVASDDRGGCYALRFTAKTSPAGSPAHSGEERGGEVLVVARAWPSNNGSNASRAARACVTSTPSKYESNSSSQSSLPGAALSVSGVAACFAGRFLPNGRQQLWLLPPAKATNAREASEVMHREDGAPLRLRSVARRGALLDSGKLCIRGHWMSIASLSSVPHGSARASTVPRVSLLHTTATGDPNSSGTTRNSSNNEGTKELPPGAVSTLESISKALMGQVRTAVTAELRDASSTHHAQLLLQHLASQLLLPGALQSSSLMTPSLSTAAFKRRSRSAFLDSFRSGLVPLVEKRSGSKSLQAPPHSMRPPASLSNSLTGAVTRTVKLQDLEVAWRLHGATRPSLLVTANIDLAARAMATGRALRGVVMTTSAALMLSPCSQSSELGGASMSVAGEAHAVTSGTRHKSDLSASLVLPPLLPLLARSPTSTLDVDLWLDLHHKAYGGDRIHNALPSHRLQCLGRLSLRVDELCAHPVAAVRLTPQSTKASQMAIPSQFGSDTGRATSVVASPRVYRTIEVTHSQAPSELAHALQSLLSSNRSLFGNTSAPNFHKLGLVDTSGDGTGSGATGSEPDTDALLAAAVSFAPHESTSSTINRRFIAKLCKGADAMLPSISKRVPASNGSRRDGDSSCSGDGSDRNKGGGDGTSISKSNTSSNTVDVGEYGWGTVVLDLAAADSTELAALDAFVRRRLPDGAQVKNLSERYGPSNLNSALESALAALQREVAHLDLTPQSATTGGRGQREMSNQPPSSNSPHFIQWLRLQAASDRAVAELAGHLE